MKLGLGLGLVYGSGVFAPTSVYVDSVVGSDSNPGTESEPFETLAAARVAAIEYDTPKLYLKRGSVFRESFEVPDNSYVGAYGTGDKPIISGCTLLPLDGWTKTDGRTNVYQYSIAPASETNAYANVTHSHVLMVWDNGVRVGKFGTIKTSVADVDATAGSFFYDATGDVLYVHASDSSDPSSNGRTYEASVRTLAMHGGEGFVVEDIHTDGVYARTTSGQQGYGILGYKAGTYRRCKATRGWNHLIGVANEETGDILFESCYAYDAEEFTPSPATLYVGYTGGTGAARTVHFKGCVAKQPNAPTTIQTQGFYGHGTRCNVIYDACASENCYYGMQTWNNDANATGTTVIQNGFTAVGCTTGIYANNLNFTDVPGLTASLCATAVNIPTTANVGVSNAKIVNCPVGIQKFAADETYIPITDCVIAKSGARGYLGVLTNGAASPTYIQRERNIFHNLDKASSSRVLAPTDNNQFSGVRIVADSTQFGTGYTTLAAWQAASSLDLNSNATAWTPPDGYFDIVITDPTA